MSEERGVKGWGREGLLFNPRIPPSSAAATAEWALRGVPKFCMVIFHGRHNAQMVRFRVEQVSRRH